MPRPIVIAGSKKKADEEIYDDGTSIKNISVSGVAEKVAMFGQSNKTTPPVLRKMREKNANLETGGSTSSGQSTDNKPPPWTVKKPSANGALPRIPKSGVTSPTSPKAPPDIPKKAKWSAGGITPPPTVAKPSNVASKSPTSPVNANIPWKKPPVTPVKKDINDNDKTEPRAVHSDSTTSNKRASVSDMMKNFQQNKNIERKDSVTSNVSPLKSSNNLNTSSEIKEVKLETKAPETPPKASIADRIAVLNKTGSDNSENSITLRKKPPPSQKPSVTRKSVIRRKSDNKSFKRVNQIQSPGPAPTKPSKLTDIDLKNIKEEYKAHLSKFGNVERASAADTDELYDDCESVSVNANKNERPVSLIPEMASDEEEYDDIGNTRIDDPTPEETYDDCGNTAVTDEIYEPLDDMEEGGSMVDEKEASERKKREIKEKKEQEKKEKDERRRKEKEEKDKQKELKKKEKEEKERMIKLKATGSETKVGDGIIKENCKGGKLDLALKSGDQVVIMRMQNNPKGKWLVTSADGKWGYVDSGNVEVSTPTIRQMMNGEECYMEADDVEGISQDVVYEEL